MGGFKAPGRARAEGPADGGGSAPVWAGRRNLKAFPQRQPDADPPPGPVLPRPCFLAAAHSNKTSYIQLLGAIQLPGAPHIDPGSVFSVANVTDGTGHVFDFPEGDTRASVLSDAMAEAFRTALDNRGALGEGQRAVDVNLTEYKPRNDFGRRPGPVPGETWLTAVAVVATGTASRPRGFRSSAANTLGTPTPWAPGRRHLEAPL